ncbi:DASH family cryptochrome [Haloplanus aerogenes]|uniref:Cryptochrome DASH n=1 Tax=Haloplanus aerogenes TaxID=660522 RepID=A0A3M0D9J5_9EURY|nr:DASH family cryptochrome [Haloplanus aerogenes]AZH26485.1 DASH family cryptochrome [Haloplanus aerogenes]RMB18045.1 deoxyribodipyrimidine photo-lyase [Haloplanus aerogenes]
MVTTTLLWLRRDLRLHDNPALVAAADADRLLPVYVFDEDHYGTADFGGTDSFTYEKTGGRRTQFRIDAIADLRSRLRDRGSDLVVRVGDPETVLSTLADRVDADAVHVHTRPTPEERAVERAVERVVDADLVRHWSHTLYHPDDLPNDVSTIDDTYTPFRKAVESGARVRTPASVPTLPDRPAAAVDAGVIPDATDLGVEADPIDDRAVLAFEGGETEGLARLDEYLWATDSLREYKETRNGLLGRDYSSKFSPWLNEGCLSPRRVSAAVDAYEDERVANDSTYWLRFELLWRDFFQFQFAKHGGTFFTPGGIRRRDIAWREDDAAFDRWTRGETGIPFVDANMRELAATGYLSNRGRQNAASFLANDLRVDWRWGAAYFETRLLDYDPASNYGNWAYVAGVGNDSRNRSFDVLWQAHRYDPDAEYVRRWVSELDRLPPDRAHEPWTLPDDERAALDYPAPMVDPETQYGEG